MAKGYNLGDLRAAIDDVIRSIAAESKCGEAQNDQVLVRLKSERRSLVSAFTPQLVDMALTKLINDVCKKTVLPFGRAREDDLFASFGKIPNRVTVTRGLKKETANLSMSEARRWLERHSKRLVKSDYQDFRKMFETIAPYARSDDETIADVLHRMEERQRRKTEELLPAE